MAWNLHQKFYFGQFYDPLFDGFLVTERQIRSDLTYKFGSPYNGKRWNLQKFLGVILKKSEL